MTVPRRRGEPGEVGALTFRVPNERADARTVRVEVFFPQGAARRRCSARPHPGWRAVGANRGPEVDWNANAGDADRRRRAGRSQSRTGPLPQADRLVFKGLQHYADGTDRALDPGAGAGRRPARAAGANGDPTDVAVVTATSGATDEESGSDGTAVWVWVVVAAALWAIAGGDGALPAASALAASARSAFHGRAPGGLCWGTDLHGKGIPVRHPLVLVAVLSIAATVSLAAGAAGPGGWSHLGDGGKAGTAALNGAVYALNTDTSGGNVLRGGTFTARRRQASAAYLGGWNGAAWSALGSSKLNGAVYAIAYHGGKVYAGGVFTNAGGNPNADFLAVWDGTSGGRPATRPGRLHGNVMRAPDHRLDPLRRRVVRERRRHRGGRLPGRLRPEHGGRARDGRHRRRHRRFGVRADRRQQGNLYAGGGFINLDRHSRRRQVAYLRRRRVARDGLRARAERRRDRHTSCAASPRHGTDVYVGTDSVDIAGIPQADHVVRWNGSAWSAMGSDTAGGTAGSRPRASSTR